MSFKAQLEEVAKAVARPDGTQEAPFQYDFALEGKSLETNVDENGDLWIEGFASDFLVDRQDEAFEPGAFERGLKAFLERNPIMLYHHKYDQALGVFTDAKVIPGQGLWVKGRVDKPATGSWAEDVFNKIRRGTIKAFSVGGIFKRRMTPLGPRIFEADLGEISVTPFPVNPRTTFAVVAQKAFSNLEGKAEGDEVATAGAEPVVEESAPPVVTEEETAVVEPVVEEEPVEPVVEDKPFELPDAAVTGEKIAPGAIKTEHLSDELRSRFSEFTPEEGPTLDSLSESLDRFGQTMNALAHHVGWTADGPPRTRDVAKPGNPNNL